MSAHWQVAVRERAQVHPLAAAPMIGGMDLEALRYPVGRFAQPQNTTDADRRRWIDDIERVPAALRAAIAGLDDAQLDTPYRDGGWTVRQVAHHLPDSHLHAYARTKYLLTEDNPTVRPYDENAWATLVDVRLPAAVSLTVLEGLHARWVAVLRAMRSSDFARTWVHPEHGKQFRGDDLLAMYSWHGRNHVAQIAGLRQRRGW